MILADNAVELLLLGLAEDFIFYDRWSVSPTWDYDRRVGLHENYEAKVAAAVEQGWIDQDQAEVARTGHYIRNAAYHEGEIGGDRLAGAWCPLVLALAVQLAQQSHLPTGTGAIEPAARISIPIVLDLCATTVLERIADVLSELHEYATNSTGPMPLDDELDEVLAHAEAAYGVGFLETMSRHKKSRVADMLRSHVYDGTPLSERQLTVPLLRTWEAEAKAHRSALALKSIAPWWRTVDRRLAVYEKTVDLANL